MKDYLLRDKNEPEKSGPVLAKCIQARENKNELGLHTVCMGMVELALAE